MKTLPNRYFSIYLVIFLNLTLSSCGNKNKNHVALEDADLYRNAVQNLTDIAVYDIFSPPVASRVYVYPNIAAYEVIAQAFPEKFNSLADQLNGLTVSPQIPDGVNPYISAIYAFNIVGKSMIFSEDKMETFQKSFDEQISKFSISRRVRKNP